MHTFGSKKNTTTCRGESERARVCIKVGDSEENGRRVQISTILASGGSQVVKVTTGVRVYPHRALAKIALADGVISENDYLLQSLFYLVGGLEDWLSKTLHPRFAERPNWVT